MLAFYVDIGLMSMVFICETNEVNLLVNSMKKNVQIFLKMSYKIVNDRYLFFYHQSFRKK